MRRIAFLFAALVVWPLHARAATWDAGVVHVPSPGGSASLGAGRRPVAVDAEGNVHVAFQSAVAEDHSQVVHILRHADGNWSEPAILSGEESARNPTIAMDDAGGIHVVWEEGTNDGRIRYRYRPAAGDWGQIASIAEAPGLSNSPVVAVDAFDRVHLVWIDGRHGRKDLLHVLGEIGGPWTPPRVISTGGGQPDNPAIGVDGLGTVHIAWSDRVGNQRDGSYLNLFSIRLEPGQESNAKTSRLIEGNWNMYAPYLAVTEDGTVHLAWLDDRTNTVGNPSEVFYRRFLPGIGWGHVKQFSRDQTQHAQPMIVEGAGGSMNLVWEDYRTGNPEIYYRQITPTTGWDPFGTRLTAHPSASQSPALAPLPEGRMLLIWTDALESNEIRVYAKLGNVVPSEP